MSLKTYYLSSLDSYALEAVRICEIDRFLTFDTGKPCAVARVDPPIPGQQFGLTHDVVDVVLANRHEGDDIRNIVEFPCFVHVACPVAAGALNGGTLRAADLQNLAWGELYRTRDDAERHVFDRI